MDLHAHWCVNSWLQSPVRLCESNLNCKIQVVSVYGAICLWNATLHTLVVITYLSIGQSIILNQTAIQWKPLNS